MNTSELKAYGPQARRDFIAAVTARAAKYGLTAKAVAPMTEQGDVVLIGGKAFPRAVAEQRRKLEQRIQQQGFAQVMEAMAYTWFNRLLAIRYMELHGYLDHGYRVLSHPAKAGAFGDPGGLHRDRVARTEPRSRSLSSSSTATRTRNSIGCCSWPSAMPCIRRMPFLFEAHR